MRLAHAAVLVVACGLPACQGPTAASPGASDMQLRPHVDQPFTRGPSLSPPDALRAWLEQQGSRTVRLPVIVTVDELHQVRAARVGELPVTLDDSALGISLADRLRQACPGQSQCLVRLEGRWDGGLRVHHFAGPIAAGQPADFAEVADK